MNILVDKRGGQKGDEKSASILLSDWPITKGEIFGYLTATKCGPVFSNYKDKDFSQ